MSFPLIPSEPPRATHPALPSLEFDRRAEPKQFPFCPQTALSSPPPQPMLLRHCRWQWWRTRVMTGDSKGSWGTGEDWGCRTRDSADSMRGRCAEAWVMENGHPAGDGSGRLRLKLLGGYEASVDGHPIRFRTRKTFALFTYLALDPRPHRRSHCRAALARGGEWTHGESAHVARIRPGGDRQQADALLMANRTWSASAPGPSMSISTFCRRRATDPSATQGGSPSGARVCR